MALDGFARFDFPADGVVRPVYRLGAGPGVVVLHVLPGILPEVVAFAERVAGAGFTECDGAAPRRRAGSS